jgi:hypothetical protein
VLWDKPNNTFLKSRKASKAMAVKARKEGFAKLWEQSFTSTHPGLQARLDEFVKFSGARGAERMACKKQMVERPQQELREQVAAIGQLWQTLRSTSVRYSFEAKVFARRIAIDDENARVVGTDEPFGKRRIQKRITADPTHKGACTTRMVSWAAVDFLTKQKLAKATTIILRVTKGARL